DFPHCASLHAGYGLPRACLSALLRIAIAAGSRRPDDDRLAGIDHALVAPLERLDAAVAATHRILSDLSGLAAGKPERRHAAVARQDGAFHLLQKPDGAADAIAGMPRAATTGIRADVKILQHPWVTELQHLGISEPRIGHVRVDRVGAV